MVIEAPLAGNAAFSVLPIALMVVGLFFTKSTLRDACTNNSPGPAIVTLFVLTSLPALTKLMSLALLC